MSQQPSNAQQPAVPDAGKLIIISGPSGVGKTTVLKRLFQTCELPLEASVSATTRPRRAGETDGVSYHYMPPAQFEKHRQNGDFLECCEVFGYGHWYGTLQEPVTTGLQAGKWVILEVDVEGAAKVLKHYPDANTIFIHPGSLEELEQRLRGRGTESEEVLKTRLDVAKREMDASSSYRHIVINQSVQQTVNDICTLLQQVEKN
jgi:guanylate kinase|tara:strand:- start:7963 stop:8574 length:612 start_codon:yes stop_codon:yes gene_type:complete